MSFEVGKILGLNKVYCITSEIIQGSYDRDTQVLPMAFSTYKAADKYATEYELESSYECITTIIELTIEE